MMKLILSKLLSNLMVLQGKIMWPSKTDGAMIPNGFKIHYSPKNKVQVYGYVTTIWKYNVYGEIEPGSVVVDAGANIGVYSLKVADKAEKIIAVEPEPKIFSFLKHNIKINNIKNVEPVNMALSDHNGFIDFYSSRQFFGEAHEISPRILHSPKNKITVPCITLDTLLQKFPEIKAVGTMKVDIEGHEPQMLMGAENTLERGLVQNFSIAVYHFKNEEKQVRNMLENYGYITKSKFFLDGDIILYAKLKR